MSQSSEERAKFREKGIATLNPETKQKFAALSERLFSVEKALESTKTPQKNEQSKLVGEDESSRRCACVVS